MNIQEAAQILERLQDGIDPATGEILPEGNPLEHPQVMQALYMATAALRAEQSRAYVEEDIWINLDGTLNQSRPWTAQDDEQLAALYLQGMTVEQLAQKLVRKQKSVRDRLSALEILRPPKPKKKGFERAGEPWTKEENALFLDMVEKNIPESEIAKALKRTVHSIHCRIKRLKRQRRN